MLHKQGGVRVHNEMGIKKTMLISPEQDMRLKYYCKKRRISASQLFRLLIDELVVNDNYDMTLKDGLKESAFKTEVFVNPIANHPIKEVINDGQGNLQTRWYGKSRQAYNSFPNANHY